MALYRLNTLKNNVLIPCDLVYTDNGKNVNLDYSCDDVKISAEDKYPFFALVKIRLILEKQSMFILCNGCRENVYPSGMSAIGLMAYELQVGKQATNLVNIFDPVDNFELIVSVERQKFYRDNWFESLKNSDIDLK